MDGEQIRAMIRGVAKAEEQTGSVVRSITAGQANQATGGVPDEAAHLVR